MDGQNNKFLKPWKLSQPKFLVFEKMKIPMIERSCAWFLFPQHQTEMFLSRPLSQQASDHFSAASRREQQLNKRQDRAKRRLRAGVYAVGPGRQTLGCGFSNEDGHWRWPPHEFRYLGAQRSLDIASGRLAVTRLFRSPCRKHPTWLDSEDHQGGR